MRIISVATLLLFASCASRAPLSYNQKCGMKGMVLAGVTTSSGDISGSSYNYQTHQWADTSGSYSGENVSCEVPKTRVQQCEANEYAISAKPVLEYNESVGTKKFLTGLGYVVYIVPGVVAKVAFDGQRDKASKQADELERVVKSSCDNQREVASEKKQ